VDRAAAAVGLAPELLNANIGTLSGGQFQKALIAFAPIGQPNVLLFDEPTASLDELTEERVCELLQVLKQEHGMTLVLVSHDRAVVTAAPFSPAQFYCELPEWSLSIEEIVSS
jgi:ABC-type Mn2+/Zn2+ transport system ATPase subunit